MTPGTTSISPRSTVRAAAGAGRGRRWHDLINLSPATRLQPNSRVIGGAGNDTIAADSSTFSAGLVEGNQDNDLVSVIPGVEQSGRVNDTLIVDLNEGTLDSGPVQRLLRGRRNPPINCEGTTAPDPVAVLAAGRPAASTLAPETTVSPQPWSACTPRVGTERPSHGSAAGGARRPRSRLGMKGRPVTGTVTCRWTRRQVKCTEVPGPCQGSGTSHSRRQARSVYACFSRPLAGWSRRAHHGGVASGDEESQGAALELVGRADAVRCCTRRSARRSGPRSCSPYERVSRDTAERDSRTPPVSSPGPSRSAVRQVTRAVVRRRAR